MSEVQTQSTYSLPSGYNDNRIILLARDPYWLYAYWEVSNVKRSIFTEDFGQGLWEKSVPVLKVTNVSKNISFYIRINDYTSNWYINVPDSDCLYIAEIGRRVSEQFFINLASSNYTTTPSRSVSSNTAAYFADYRDLKKGRLNLQDKKITEEFKTKFHEQFILGPSSPELLGRSLEESQLGVSSAELPGINLAEHLLVSSDVFYR